MTNSNIDHFYAADGARIIFRRWQPETMNHRVIVILHRGHEHSERTQALALSFVNQGYQVYAWDSRGNGLSEGERDDAASYTVFESDLDRFIQRIQKETGLGLDKFVLIASSMGALTVASWVHDYAPKIRGMILATPAFKIRLYIPFAEPLLFLARKLNLMPRVSSYVKSVVLTHDRQEQQVYNDDPLISSSISTDLLLDTLRTGRRLVDDAGAITTPTLVLSAGKDWVVHRTPQRRFYERLSSAHKEWVYNTNGFHALFNEDDREKTFARCHQFVENVFKHDPVSHDYSKADQYGYSRDRYDSLQLPCLNPIYPLARFGIQYFGGISHGIKIGREQGFDSGASLNYVYQNHPAGQGIPGRWIDQLYLNAPGWMGIRERKIILSSMIEQCINSRRKVTSPSDTINIMDIASGNGQYLFDFLADNNDIHAELRELLPHNIELMKQKTEQLNLTDQIDLVQTDAFDENSYLHPDHYDLVISSGLFELFSDNQNIQTAIKGIHHQLKENGYYIYTNQPWHSQQKFIAKTLKNHRGEFWLMRCRTQAEIDNLVEAAGLTKIDMLIDKSGMFTVSIAQKRSGKTI